MVGLYRLRRFCKSLTLCFVAGLFGANLLGEGGERKIQVVRPAAQIVGVTLRPGETLNVVLRRFGVDGKSAHALSESLRPYVKAREMRAGQSLQIILDAKGSTVKGLEYRLPGALVSVESSADKWSAKRVELHSARVTRVVRGTLSKNLYRDGTTAGLTPAQILELADIFQYDVDFFSDFRRGDTFSVAFEEIRYEDGPREAGKILAAELIVGGDPVQAFRYTTQKGEEAYYDVQGRSLRRAFLRAPLNYRRISSLYSPKRMHPILRTVRPHQAIDYAAAMGTPVVSIGRGTVKFAGWHDGYGNLVEVAHGNEYTTRYAHLSRFASGLGKGTRIAQGHVIGFVGQTGHATGPHLHFELMKGQRKINFLALRIPSQEHLGGEELARFAVSRGGHLALLRDEKVLLAQGPS